MSDVSELIEERLREKFDKKFKGLQDKLYVQLCEHMEAYADFWLNQEGVGDDLKHEIVALLKNQKSVLKERTARVDLSPETLRKHYESELALIDRIDAVVRRSDSAKAKRNVTNLSRVSREEAKRRYDAGLKALEKIQAGVEQVRAKALRAQAT